MPLRATGCKRLELAFALAFGTSLYAGGASSYVLDILGEPVGQVYVELLAM